MAKANTIGSGIENCMSSESMRALVKQYSELGQWTSALFWADAAAAAAGGGLDSVSGDDVWLLASAMLARGEPHRAAHAVCSRGLHRRHLLCLGVAMRAYVAARDPETAIKLMEECDPMLLEPRSTEQTHNRALGGVLVWQARALAALDRRDAAAEALTSALRADCACYEALDLLLDQHALTPHQERELIESLPINTQLSAAEGALLRTAYRERLNRYSPPPPPQLPSPDTECPITVEAEAVWCRMLEAVQSNARRLTAACRWDDALKALDVIGPWCCLDVRVACLVEQKKSAQLFALAHELVDAYPTVWTSWYAVGCYYYLIGKNEIARRYLSKAKSLEPSAGCVWLAFGHCFAAEPEHDQAMAAYVKACQVMAGCHLPPMYVGVECALLNNFNMCERFFTRAAALHNDKVVDETTCTDKDKWGRVVSLVRDPHVAHEAGAAAFADGNLLAARDLWLTALEAATPSHSSEVPVRWAATLDALGHVYRALGHPSEALRWHERALALRPARSSTLTAMALCLALLSRERDAADALHAALAKDPDDVVALALLDIVIHRIDRALTDEDLQQFPFQIGRAHV